MSALRILHGGNDEIQGFFCKAPKVAKMVIVKGRTLADLARIERREFTFEFYGIIFEDVLFFRESGKCEKNS